MRQQLYRILQKLRSILRDYFHQYNHKLSYVITVIIALIIVVGGINIFIELTDTLKSNHLARIDDSITDFVISFRSPSLNKFLQFITHVGDIYGYAAIILFCTVLFYLKFKNWKLIVQMFIVLVISSLSNLALKQVINRARPNAEHLVSVATLSYPSGHAMTAMAFYGFLSYLIYKFKINFWVKSFLIVFCAFMVISIGFSRIYLGVHFPSDVVGGWIAGAIWVAFCITIFNLMDLFRREEESKQE